jgi:CDP-glucose 4,6-dehydratase
MKKNFWNKKKVLITGVNGFVGSNICKKLLSLDANITGLIRNRNEKTLLFLEKLNKKILLVEGSIDNKETLKRIFLEQNIEICFHLAAQVEVGIARDYPNLTWESNIRGTYNFLEAVREQGKNVKAIIVASSDKAYGSYPKQKMPYKEHYELKAKFPYDVSKACAELIARSYTSELFNLPIAITRFANIYGPGQVNFSALIPDCIQAALEYGKFTPRGNGNNVRDFLYVKDVVDLYILIAKKLFLNPNKIKGQIFNAGTNKPMKIKDIIKTIFIRANKEKEYLKITNKFKNKKTRGEIDYQYMDHQKVKKYFGWSPKYNFKKGINETFNWYKENIKKLV